LIFQSTALASWCPGGNGASKRVEPELRLHRHVPMDVALIASCGARQQSKVQLMAEEHKKATAKVCGHVERAEKAIKIFRKEGIDREGVLLYPPSQPASR
jgi:hypothetical protein